MQRFATLLIALTLVATLPLPAQEPPPLVEAIEVTIVNLDVVVTDRKGQRVRGLTRDDFEVFENGVPQPITNFFEVTSSPAAPAPAGTATAEPERRRNFVIFLDENTLTPFNRKPLLEKLAAFVDATMRPGDAAAVVSWSRSLTLEAPFTADRQEVLDALDRLGRKPPLGTLRATDKSRVRERLLDLVENYSLQARPGMPPQKPSYEEALREVTSYADVVAHDLRQTAAAMRGVMASLSGVEGRKIFIYATESLPQQPGREAFEFLDGIREKFEGGESRSAISDGNGYNSTIEIEAIADAANANGFVLYPIHAAGAPFSVQSADQALGDDAAVQAALRSAASVEMANESEPLRTLARATGGQALIGTKNFDVAFSAIRDDLTSYYSLGYRAEAGGDDVVRSVDVRVKKRGSYNVRARRSLLKKSHESEMRDAVVAHLFHLGRKNDLGVTVASGGEAQKREDGRIVVPLVITIPMSSLTLVPEGTDLAGQISLFAAFLRNDGAVSELGREKQQFRFPAESLKRRKELTMKLDVDADSRTGRISIGVVDGVSRAAGYAVWECPGSER